MMFRDHETGCREAALGGVGFEARVICRNVCGARLPRSSGWDVLDSAVSESKQPADGDGATMEELR